MSDPAATLFEKELSLRSMSFRLDPKSGRYIVEHQGKELFVSLGNLRREYGRDFDESRVARFIDSVLSLEFRSRSWEEVRDSILFCIEPTDDVERSNFRRSISDLVDRVPVHFDATRGTITWISPSMLSAWSVDLEEVEAAASNNLGAILAQATLQHQEIDGVRLGYLETVHPFKSAMILAPNLREVVSPLLGWPLYAVIPDRNFLYMWAAEHKDFAARLGGVVVDEFGSAPYPISTEVFEISDEGIMAIGEFPAKA
jgi:hypothetical protein